MEQAPARLGRYELIARLASGGMGEVFLGRLDGAQGFEKLYAIKRILPHLATDERFRKMLITEAQIASKMAHPNICQVYELGEQANGQLYIVMEYLEGISLLPLLRKCAREQTPLDFGFIAAVLNQVCDALQYAHDLRDRNGESLNVIHRDVTLANVFVCESGTAKVLDFGIAKVKDTSNTQTDTIKGKYAYMAPEQLKGGELSRRVDVFALGVVTYEMLALRRLFQRKTDYLTFRAVMEQPIADIRRYRPEISETTVAALVRALERDPDKRFETVREFRAALFDADVKPWGQEDVGELVRTRFSTEIGSTSAGVATAITHSGPPKLEKPLIEPPPPAEDDEDFPEAESVAGPMTAATRAIASSMQAVPSLTPMPARRSPIWAVLALLLVGAAGTALFLLWRGQQGARDKVDIEVTDNESPENQAAVVPFTGKLGMCAARHPSKLENVTANLKIGPAGTVESSSFEPAELEGTPLGTCLIDVLRTVPFPKRNRASLFSLAISLPKQPPTARRER